jgi:cell wall-associated NlpC family hydrolase
LAAVLTLAGLTACEPTVLITAPGEATAPVETAGERAVGYAQSELGTPYLWGGRTPGVGFDCSGLTSWAWGQAGTFLPRTSGDQYTFTSRIARADLRAGDLVFYAADGVTISHVAMYVGDGRIIHARKTGTYVEYQGIDWWASNRVGYGRVGA